MAEHSSLATKSCDRADVVEDEGGLIGVAEFESGMVDQKWLGLLLIAL